MNKHRIEALERQVKQKTGKNDHPSPGFFIGPDVESRIEDWRTDLLRQGFTLEAVNLTPAFIEGLI
jgi:hypothetical protein